MTPPQQHVDDGQPLPSVIVQESLTYKLFLLENARNTLEQELLDFTNKAYGEVQGFFRSSVPTCMFSDIAAALDSKCQTVCKLSALLKDLTAEPHICVRNGLRTNQLRPLGNKGIPMTDVLKFGSMLWNLLMANSIAKAVQVLGATLPFGQKHFLISQHAAVQQDDMTGRVASSYNNDVATMSSSSHLKAEKKEHAIVFEDKCPPDAVSLPPAIIQCPRVSAERPPVLLPPTQAIFPEISNPNPVKIPPLISRRCEDDVQVQHQKQTSSQLLHFLRAKAKNMGVPEVTVMEWSESMFTSSSPQSMSPAFKSQKCQFGHVVTDDLIDAQTAKMLSADAENQAPVFRVKRVESNGSLTYTCVIATKTELWDVGDIYTEVGQGGSEAGPSENKDCRINITAQVTNSCMNIQTALHCTEPEHEGNSAVAKMSAINVITIPEFQIRRFEETEVVVSHIVSPGNFYIQQADSTTKLQALVTDSWKASSSYAEQNCIPDIGTKVMGWFPNQEQWCRAQVTKICGISGDNHATHGAGSGTSIKVEVKRLDYGDAACLSLQHIKELAPEMAILPLQAVQVSLANVMPVNGSDWSEEAVDWFQTMVHNRTLYARLYPQGPKVTVELFLEKGKLGAMRRGAPLSLRLAQNGHAKHSKLRNVDLKRSAVQVKMRDQDHEWEKYLIMHYTRNKK